MEDNSFNLEKINEGIINNRKYVNAKLRLAVQKEHIKGLKKEQEREKKVCFILQEYINLINIGDETKEYLYTMESSLIYMLFTRLSKQKISDVTNNDYVIDGKIFEKMIEKSNKLCNEMYKYFNGIKNMEIDVFPTYKELRSSYIIHHINSIIKDWIEKKDDDGLDEYKIIVSNQKKFDTFNDFYESIIDAVFLMTDKLFIIFVNFVRGHRKLGTLTVNEFILANKKLCISEKEQQPITKKKNIIKKIKRKQPIPDIVKTNVWNKYIGEDVGKAKCMCCGLHDISQRNFHCGHVTSEKNGGRVILKNLRPICSKCNGSIGTKNMDEFMKQYEL